MRSIGSTSSSPRVRISIMTERKIHIENYADRDLQAELDKIQAEFDTEMRRVFGVVLTNPATTSCEPNSTLDTDLIITMLKKAITTMEKQRKLLLEADKVTEATAVDANVGQVDEIILTDFQRAVEFLDKNNPRKNGDSLRKVWGKLIEEAMEDIQELSPMPYRKPSFFLPRGLQSPVFGVYDRSIWNQQRKFMDEETRKRIESVNLFVNQEWLLDDENQLNSPEPLQR